MVAVDVKSGTSQNGCQQTHRIWMQDLLKMAAYKVALNGNITFGNCNDTEGAIVTKQIVVSLFTNASF